MSLTRYKQKRSFNKTPEPTGGKASARALKFVIQLHDASRLHYDFRLEMDGALKSWAVPKGPSTDPATKRLAMMVEDHPMDYRNFEGIIPKGNYGAGTVIVWDEGTYTPIDNIKGVKAQEKHLLQQLKAGSLKIRLNGHKLKGEYALVKTKGMGDNAWLLIKHKDEFASTKDITRQSKSVQSGKTIAGVSAAPQRLWKSNAKKTAAPTRKPAQKTTRKKSVQKRKKYKLPATISPMLATLVDKPFDDPGWLYEIKWDGYRALGICDGDIVNLVSRNNKSFNEKFYPVYEAVRSWNIHGIVDGEIAVINAKGISDFGALQNWRSEADGELFYYVFDLLWLNGTDLTQLPLKERREMLRSIMPAEGIIRLSESFDTSGTAFLSTAAKMGIEGMIAKKEDSEYLQGRRSKDWLKIKIGKRHEVVVGGFTKNKGSSKLFSSLLVGVYEQNKLVYTGKIGTGFTVEQQEELMKKFKLLIRKTSPFAEIPDVNKPSRFRPNPPNAEAIWLKPQLIVEVSYTEVTADGLMRHPSFEGLREDKDPKDVIRELPVKASSLPALKNTKTTKKKLVKPAASTQRKTLLNPSEKTQVRKINGNEIRFTNLDKIYWPKEKYTKRELLNYYYQVALYILPYLKDRPQSLNRFPNGINGKSFYQKDLTGKAPGWIDLFPYTTSEGEKKNYMLCNKESDLLFMVNQGCIEINPWSSTSKNPDHPDWCLIDLDPSARNDFDDVITVAKEVKIVLDEIGIEGYCKTSGSTGMHVYIPLQPKYSYDEVQLLGRWIATHVNERLPGLTSVERVVKKRRGKLYIDFLQNRPGATLAAPYSARPKPGATVSMPVHWEEVKKGLSLKDFTIKNAVARLRSEGDIFKPVLGKGVDLKKILAVLE